MRIHVLLPTRRLWPAAMAIAILAVTSTLARPQQAENSSTSTTQSSKPVELDRVIAIINGDVLLESDVQEEMVMAALQPIGVLPGQNTRRRAGERLINRTLILQQMKEQQSLAPVSDEEVQKSLDELRKQIPECAKYKCTTPQGWDEFLNAHGLTESQVEDRWRQRLQILHFIDVRFRSGIRIPKSDTQDYYDKTLVPAFQKQNQAAPPLASISSRIEEVLLQQRVSALLQDWLKSLRDQGSVQILDATYGQSSGNEDEDSGGSA